MIKEVETVIIGGGQAGLATSYFLTRMGREHLVLEQAAEAANAWRNDRWDSFTLVTPNWSVRLPGGEYQGDDPHGFMARDKLVTYFENYIANHRLPVGYGVRVTAVEPSDSGPGYRVETNETTYRARNVVMATGIYQRPNIPACSANLSPGIRQLHSSQYRNPHSLPEGAVLVVGSGQSGCQIAEELYQHGRQVYLCVGRAGRVPRRYRGRDIFEWLTLVGYFDRTPGQLPSPEARFAGIPHLSGRDGGHSLNLHQFARDGVRLLGRLRDARDHHIWLAGDLQANLSAADAIEAEITGKVDGYIAAAGLDAPPERLPELTDGRAVPETLELDLAAAGINTIIWACGYAFDFSLVKLPAFDDSGFPIQKRGVTAYPGLYFAGLPWMDGQRSGLLLGVAESAEHVARAIAGS
jgi:putative flavoprotein involved in K+ transport